MVSNVYILDPLLPVANSALKIKTPVRLLRREEYESSITSGVAVCFIRCSQDWQMFEQLVSQLDVHGVIAIAVLSSQNWDWPRILNLGHFRFYCFMEEAEEKLDSFIAEALELFKKKQNETQRLESYREQNMRLEKGQTELHERVEQRTASLALSKKELEDSLNQTRGIMRFIQGLTTAISIEDLFHLLHQEVKGFRSVGSPILFYKLRVAEGQLLSYQVKQVISRPIKIDESEHLRIRVNDLADSMLLAKALERPFGRVLAFPFRFRQSHAWAQIFFEHQLEGATLNQFLTFISERLQAFGVALDRVLLDIDLRRASRQWETTFDSVSNPIAILDLDLQVLRANRLFSTPLLPSADDEVSQEEWQKILAAGQPQQIIWKVRGDLYQVEFFPIKLQGSSRADHMICYYTDMTRTMDLQSQVIQSEKMVALGHLAGHIAHELNNPLTGIRALAQVLLKEDRLQDQMQQDLVEVEKAVERSQKIILNLLDYARADEETFAEQIVDLNEVVERTLLLVKTLLRDFNQDVELCKEKLWVRGVSYLLQQVVFNLVQNACQATRPGGRIGISTGIEGDWALILIEDSGLGISPEVKKHLFEPFFTTKAKGKGTGLGLSLSQRWVQNMKGKIEVTSIENKGATFKVMLPLMR